jgi:hypothetical protein
MPQLRCAGLHLPVRFASDISIKKGEQMQHARQFSVAGHLGPCNVASSPSTGPEWWLVLIFVTLLVVSIIILFRNATSIRLPVRMLYAIVAPIIFLVCMMYNIALSAKLMPLIFGAAADSPGLGFLTATPLAVVGVRLWYLALRRVARADSKASR